MIDAREARKETSLNWTPENKVCEEAKRFCENEIDKCIRERIKEDEESTCLSYRNRKLLKKDFYLAVKTYLRDNGYTVYPDYFDDQIVIYWEEEENY